MALLTACGTSPQPTSSVAPGTSPAQGGPSTGTAVPSAPAEGSIGPSSVLQVVADDLRLRAEPNTTAALVAAMPRGHVTRVESGPVEADGFRWWELVDADGVTGWAADGDGADPWLASAGGTAAEPLLRLSYGCDVTGPIRAPATTILADGTVILAEAGFDPGDLAPPTWLTGRLSTAGIEHVRQNLLGSPYLQASAEYAAEPLPEAEPPGHGACLYEFTVGDDEVVVAATGWFGDEEEAAFWQPSPERKTLTEFAESLISLDDVLADSLWATPPTLPYLPMRYSVVRTESPAAEPLPSGVPRLGEDPIVSILADPHAETQIGPCWDVELTTAFDLASTLTGTLPAWPFQGVGGAAYVVDGTHFGLTVVPQTPVGEPSCADIASR